MNTDVAVLTIFTSLGTVSVYTVYLMAISALRGILSSFCNSYQSALGKYIAEDNIETLCDKFKKFESWSWFLCIATFATCLLLINPFVKLYTSGIHDENYFQPIFAIIIVLANAVYSVREPYRLLILAAGKFKETNFGSTMEAVLNLVISIILVWKFGLIGVAIGTLIAIGYRYIYFLLYLKKHIIYREYHSYMLYFATSTIVFAINIYIYFNFGITADSFMKFLEYGILILAINIFLYQGLYHGFVFIQKALFKK